MARKPGLILMSLILSLTGWAQEDTTWINTEVFYEIQKEGEVQGYVLGTIHSQDPRVHAFDSSLFRDILSVDAFALELNPEEVDYSAVFQMMEMDSSLADIYEPEDLSAISVLLRARTGMNPALFMKMRPLFLAFLCMEEIDLIPAEFEILDFRLAEYAKGQGKEIIGLETPEEQFSALSNIPPDFEIKLLLDLTRKSFRDSLKASEGSEKELTDTWLFGGLDSLDFQSEILNLPQEFLDGLIDNRNEIMAERILEEIKSKTLFIAVGAGHLNGENGLLKLLQAEGYQIQSKPLRFRTFKK